MLELWYIYFLQTGYVLSSVAYNQIWLLNRKSHLNKALSTVYIEFVTEASDNLYLWKIMKLNAAAQLKSIN